MYKHSKRYKFETLRGQLDIDFSTFTSHYRDLGDYILPRRIRFTTTDVNRGDKRNLKIIDSTATLAARTLQAGMMSGITSPARPWFRLTTPDPVLAEMSGVKDWLHFVSQRMTTVFLKSNIYNILPTVYGDLGTFGTAAHLIEEDLDTVIRGQSFPIGSYRIAKNYRGQVNTFYREFRMTVRQLVDHFGAKNSKGDYLWDNFSMYVQSLYNQAQYEAWVDVRHVIMPNDDYVPESKIPQEKKFISCYYEAGTSGTNESNYLGAPDEGRFLRESGYDIFPVLCPRWSVTGEDVYGTDCPGMTALGDIKALQLMQKRKSQAIEKMINPPMVGPTHLRNQKASILPGDTTWLDVREGMQGFRPAHEVNMPIQELLMDIRDHQQRISRAFYEDLFLMLAQSDRRQITAREIDERKEEKLLALGPVLEQLNQDELDPLVDNTFYYMLQQGLVPPAPPELQGIPLKIEYISVMAQAQKLIGISGIERFAGFVGQLTSADPSARDKIDIDQMIDVYSDMTSVPPGIVRTDEQVAQIRNQRAQAQQAQQQAAMLQQSAGAAKDLSQADLSKDNALSRLLQQGQ